MPTTTVNLVGGETYTLISGGFLYQFFMWFSWGIYTIWTPRNIYTFSDFYKSTISMCAPYLIYGLILLGMGKKKMQFYVTIFFAVWLFSLFLIKAAQPPFGEIFQYLIDKVSFFRIFRSPDSKFSFGIVFSLMALLMLVSDRFKKQTFCFLLITVILIQSFPLYSGVAIRGQKTKTSTDRIISIPSEYLALSSYLNSQYSDSYALPIPLVDEYTHYNLNGKRYIGQDLLTKISEIPFIHVSTYSGMASITYKKLFASLRSPDLQYINDFPIQYFILRNDLLLFPKATDLRESVEKRFKLVYKTSSFTVYENLKAKKIISGLNVKYKKVNSVKYIISVQNIKENQKIIFGQSFNSNWRLYEPSISLSENDMNPQDIMRGFLTDEFSNVHKVGNGYSNEWTLGPKNIKSNLSSNSYTVNKDGSINLRLILYYKSQSYFFVSAVIAILYTLILYLIFYKHEK